MASSRLSPLERVGVFAGIATALLGLLFGMGTMKPDAFPWLVDFVKPIGYAAIFFFGLTVIALGRALLDIARESALLGMVGKIVRSPARWWPPLKRKKQRETTALRQLVVASMAVLKAFETLMDTDLQPADNQIDLVSEAWAQMNSAMRTYDTALVDAPEWLREEHRSKIYRPLRKMVDTKADPARFYGEAGVLRDWLLEQRRNSPN